MSQDISCVSTLNRITRICTFVVVLYRISHVFPPRVMQWRPPFRKPAGESMTELSVGKIMLASMYGPSVNWKLIKSLTAIEKQAASACQLLKLGSCGLHGNPPTVHTASGHDVNAEL